mmetsp:Transcript_3782/g.9450  ORF Transcript_3782/g.9450 Transcript_3782/m.9450 type:complete len:220 (-) Transcript_3782:3988-4647(-)
MHRRCCRGALALAGGASQTAAPPDSSGSARQQTLCTNSCGEGQEIPGTDMHISTQPASCLSHRPGHQPCITQHSSQQPLPLTRPKIRPTPRPISTVAALVRHRQTAASKLHNPSQSHSMQASSRLQRAPAGSPRCPAQCVRGSWKLIGMDHSVHTIKSPTSRPIYKQDVPGPMLTAGQSQEGAALPDHHNVYLHAAGPSGLHGLACQPRASSRCTSTSA